MWKMQNTREYSTSLHIQTIKRYSSVISSFIMIVITLYHNHKTLKLSIKDRERPRIIELLRFCKAPPKKWLEPQLGRAEFKEFNLEELLISSVALNDQKPDSELH